MEPAFLSAAGVGLSQSSASRALARPLRGRSRAGGGWAAAPLRAPRAPPGGRAPARGARASAGGVGVDNGGGGGSSVPAGGYGAAAKVKLPKPPKSTVAGLAMTLVTMLLAVPLFLAMLVCHPLVMLFDGRRRRFHMFTQMLWMRLAFFMVGIRVKVNGAKNLPDSNTTVAYVANHQSYLDIFAMAFMNRPLKYVSKTEIFKLPIVGWSMFLTGNVALKRMDRRGQMEAFKNMIECMAQGSSLVVYPEGTRSETGKMRMFQKGAFRAAKQAKAKIVPVTIQGTSEIMPTGSWTPIGFAKNPITLTVHPSLDTTDAEVEDLRNSAYKSVVSVLPQESEI